MPDTMGTQASRLADIYSGYLDEPQSQAYTNPSFGADPRFKEFLNKLNSVMPGFGPQGHNPQQFGTFQNPPQYRGIRLLLPNSVTAIPSTSNEDSYKSLEFNRVPNHNGLYQMFLGEMIRRGFPVLGGTGQMYGKEQGFNPIGFGQR
jgi:hypothetical protein